jgi:cytochrome d ubiquinol oxidase subunit I
VTDLLAARLQMAISLAFHIWFAVAGIAMPVLMVISEWRWRRTGDAIYLDLAKRWMKGTAILFAVGAVSGTVLSFELGLLWPTFMEHAGPIIGMPFSMEGFAFFLEAIFLGVYLYGWDRIGPRTHLLSGVLVAVAGCASGIFVMIVNAWMNAPRGFDVVDGRLAQIDPIAGMANPATIPEALHMTLAAYAAVGFAVAGIHAFLLLRDPQHPFHRRALAIALWVGVPAAIALPISGDVSARYVARHQPAKLAAMEALFETRRGAPLWIGGWPDEETRTVRFGIEIPYGLSLLAFHDPNAQVTGLNDIPADERPPVVIVHLAFQAMVALGTYLAIVGIWVAWRAWRRRDLVGSRALLRALVVAAPMGLIAIQAGWVVTEVGRQPWVIYGVMRTADAVTPMPGLVVPLSTFTLLYLGLGTIVVFLLSREVAYTAPRATAAPRSPEAAR